eukprot:gene49497-67213_t
MDAVGSAIRVDSRGREVMRILPRVNEAVNEEWISDKTRFIWDGLRTQRLDRPYVRKDGKLVPASWAEAFSAIKDAVSKAAPEKIGAISGDLAAVEEIYALKQLMAALGSKNNHCRQDGAALGAAQIGGNLGIGQFGANLVGNGSFDATPVSTFALWNPPAWIENYDKAGGFHSAK